MRHRDRVVLITGGGAGLGRVMAQMFAKEGAHLALAGRRREPLDATAASIKELGREALVVPTDVVQESQVAEMVKATVERYGRIDILANNAAQPGQDLHVWEQTLENWNQTIAVDLTGPMLCSREVLRQSMLQNRSGVIINFSSTASWKGIPRKSHYAVAKSGVRLLTKVLAQEVGPHGIRVNCVVPGTIEGELVENYWKRLAGERGVPWQDVGAEFVERTALKRICRPEEVAALAVFLASDEANAITGQSINVDAGVFMTG